MTDKDRILARLRDGNTVSPVDYQAPTVDGGKPILRVAARINDLRNEGHRIDTIGKKHGCAVYALVRSAPRLVEQAERPGPPRGHSGVIA